MAVVKGGSPCQGLTEDYLSVRVNGAEGKTARGDRFRTQLQAGDGGELVAVQRD